MPGDTARENGKKGGRPRGRKDGPASTRTVKREAAALKLAALRARVLRHAELSADATLEQIRRMGFYDIRRLFDARGNLRPIQELTEAEAACIAGIEVVKRKNGDDWDDVVKVKIADRGRYLEMAAKSHGLLVEKVEHDHTFPEGGVQLVFQQQPGSDNRT